LEELRHLGVGDLLVEPLEEAQTMDRAQKGDHQDHQEDQEAQEAQEVLVFYWGRLY
jgi:hypothetical protein